MGIFGDLCHLQNNPFHFYFIELNLAENYHINVTPDKNQCIF